MALLVIGAGVGRTGTMSLKGALETLLGGPCYHMLEVLGHPEHVEIWHAAGDGGDVDWDALLAGYAATTDFPACLFWRELLERYPDAVVLLSTRSGPQTWWESASQTIFSPEVQRVVSGMPEWWSMWQAVSRGRFTEDVHDEASAKAAYERHNADVRASVPASQLIDWQPGDGWAPICARLGLPVPDEAFPHVNTRAEVQARIADPSSVVDLPSPNRVPPTSPASSRDRRAARRLPATKEERDARRIG
jgi:Sulfotransferase domain